MTPSSPGSGSGSGPQHMAQALQNLDNMVQSQAVMLATNQMFLILAVVLGCVAAGVWLLPKPKGPVRMPVGGH